jgi:signal peptidase I
MFQLFLKYLMSDQSNAEQKPSSKSPMNGQRKTQNKPWLDGLLSLLMAIAVVMAIRSVLIEAFKIPSGSMIPTLYIGDQIFVNKASYGIRVPYTDWIGEKPIYIVKFDPPKSGDIIVFKYPEDPSIYYIKRVVGTPGDTIEMRNKVIYLNSKALDRNDVEQEKLDKIFADLKDNPRYPRERMDVRYEKFRDDKTGTIMIDKMAYFSENFPQTTVPEDHYFVMGDNRDDSQDSRFWGFVPFENIKGRAMVIWLSVWFEMGEGISNMDLTFRPERIGTVLK